MELNNLQNLAIAQAVSKVVKDQIDPRGGKGGQDNMRTQADADLRALYEANGTDRVAININGKKVGTLSATFTKEEEKTRLSYDGAAGKQTFLEWLLSTDAGKRAVDMMVSTLDEEKIIKLATMQNEGEIPPGCTAQTVTIPSMWKGTTLRVDVSKVDDALGKALPEAVAGLLE